MYIGCFNACDSALFPSNNRGGRGQDWTVPPLFDFKQPRPIIEKKTRSYTVSYRTLLFSFGRCHSPAYLFFYVPF